MKFTFFILLASMMGAFASSGYSQTNRLTMNVQDISVEDFLKLVENQSSYRFFYSGEIDVDQKMSGEFSNASINEILDKALKGTGIDYEISGRQVILKSNATNQSNQQINANGKVTDSSGSPLPGVTVVIKGTTQGTISDGNGNYTLSNVPGDAILVFSFVGMRTQEISVNGKNIINVELVEETQGIEEVVAIGYGTVKKSDLTGSVFQVSSDVIRTQSVMKDPIQVLQGKVPGLDITTGNKPGDVSTPIIRGYNSINASNAPLIVLDGAPFGGRINDINPAEIENIDVLKDASSTAIYGSRGANGVIIITTKRAKEGKKVSFSYDGYAGISKSFKDFDVMGGEKWANYLRAANPGRTDTDIFDQEQLDLIANKDFIDWQKLIFDGTGYETDHNFSISTNNKVLSNMIILGYNKNQSIIENMSYERFSARVNGDVKITDNISVGYSTMVSHSLRDNGVNNVFLRGTLTPPIGKVYDENGDKRYYSSVYAQSFSQSNPLFDIDQDYLQNESLRDRVFFNLFAEWEIVNELKFRSSLTSDWQFFEGGYYEAATQDETNSASYSKGTDKSLIITNILSYEKDIEDHHFSVSFVHDMQEQKLSQIKLTGQDIAYYGKWYNVDEAPNIFTRESSFESWSILSFMGRLNYTFKDKYLFTLTGRQDGSSRLAEGNKWDFFPSAAVAWRISSESFMESVPTISNLKLRLSWGNTGNTAIDPYATQGALGSYPYAFGAAENAAIGYLPTELPNEALGWEITEEYNGGLDFGFFRNRLNGSIDLYQRNTSELLMKRSLPITSGYSSTWQNIGKTKNSGIEIALNAVIIDKSDFEWDMNLSFGYNKNEIVELYNGTDDDPGNKWFIGQPLYVEWLYDFDGIWQLGQEDEATVYGRVPGDARVQDKNNSGTYDTEDLVIHNSIPKWTGGISSSFKYKNFDLNFYAYTRQDYGSRIGVLTFEAGSSRWNHLDVDFWTPENPSNTSPKPIGSNSQPLLTQSNYSFRDLSFIRVKNINLGYTFSKNVLQYIKAESLRAYVAVDNPFVWTMHDFEGLDPENATAYDQHRPLTTFLIGVNVKF